MRKLICSVLMISGLAMGCGGDGKKEETKKDAGGIGIPDDASQGGDEDPYPNCPRSDIPAEFPVYSGAKIMTMDSYQACSTMCNQDQTCFDACPGAKEFGDCLNNDVVACSAKKKGTCRKKYENFECCNQEAKCGQTDSACVEAKCGSDLTAIRDCIGADMICLRAAGTACFAPGTAAAAASLSTNASQALTIDALTSSLLKHITH